MWGRAGEALIVVASGAQHQRACATPLGRPIQLLVGAFRTTTGRCRICRHERTVSGAFLLVSTWVNELIEP